jgi:hypothetical protein
MMSPAAPLASFDREYLPIRAKILEIASALDRLDRGHATVGEEQRFEQLRAGIGLLLSDAPGRAEQVQLLFSRPYDEQWRAALGV